MSLEPDLGYPPPDPHLRPLWATSLPVVSVERTGARCSKTDVGQLMQKVKKLKGSGLSSSSTMRGHVENGQWVNLTGGIHLSIAYIFLVVHGHDKSI